MLFDMIEIIISFRVNFQLNENCYTYVYPVIFYPIKNAVLE